MDIVAQQVPTQGAVLALLRTIFRRMRQRWEGYAVNYLEGGKVGGFHKVTQGKRVIEMCFQFRSVKGGKKNRVQATMYV